MNIGWFDILTVSVMLGVVAYEMRQEFGRALLDMALLLAAVYVSRSVAPWAGGAVQVSADAGINETVVTGGLFLVLAVLGILFSRFLHRCSRWTMDQFDPIFGVAFGLVTAIVVGHSLTHFMAGVTSVPGAGPPPYLSQSVVAQELVSFRSYHFLVDTLERYQKGG